MACGALLLSGCASGYESFYKPVTTYAEVAPLKDGVTPAVIGGSGEPRRDLEVMYERGYQPVGYSVFNGRVEGFAGAIKVARKSGATIIVVDRKFTNTVSGQIPITTPTVNTSYSSGTVYSGSRSGSYTATTTTYGSETRYVPYSVDRYDQTAVYFAPLPRRGVGVLAGDIDGRDAAKFGTGRGAFIRAIRRGGPAFNADLLAGDIVRSIDGVDVVGFADFVATLKAKAGATITLVIRRQGQDITKTLPVPAGDW